MEIFIGRKRTNLNEVRNASETASTGEVWNKYSSDEGGDDLDDTVILVEILRDNFGRARSYHDQNNFSYK